tara:strand:+ start:640 stop:942 length:303 start_codon:yes stop_codon:yes gene_type:complete
MKKSNLMAISVVVCMLAACGSSEDVDAVAAGMMTGSDLVSEKDAKCMAKNLKKIASNDQWDTLVKINKGEMDEQDMSMDQAMGMMGPTMAAAAECGVKLF